MAKTLYLLRHAKSSWADAGLEDAARPLAKRGRKAGRRMGRELARRGWLPDLVLCSTAMRTRETFARLSKGIEAAEPGATPEVVFEDGLYLAGAAALLARARTLDDAIRSVLFIGHNPGLQDFALALAPKGEGRARIEAKFPTSALAVIRFEGEGWASLARGAGHLEAALYPRDLD
jgi:phosphohistidine phosphatase